MEHCSISEIPTASKINADQQSKSQQQKSDKSLNIYKTYFSKNCHLFWSDNSRNNNYRTALDQKVNRKTYKV